VSFSSALENVIAHFCRIPAARVRSDPVLKERIHRNIPDRLPEADSIYLLPIYYAGGTAQKDVSSEDIIYGLGPAAFKAYAVRDRDELMNRLRADAKPEDCVLLMGARDPSLPALVKNIVEMFGGEVGLS
jgi:UDP-N-acetylmuramate--alanine ligase